MELPHPRRHASLGIVFLIVFIDLIGFGIVIPILPLYAESFGPSPWVLGLLMASFSAMQFVAAPILGRLSDRYGRRPVLALSLLGSALGYVLFACAGSMAVLFASRIIDGISGGNISTAQAVIADITSPRDRAKGMGMIGAAFGLGFVLGPAFGGVLVSIRPWLPGVGAAVTSLVAFVLVVVLLPETAATAEDGGRRRVPLDLQALSHALRHRAVGLCLVAVFLVVFAFANFEVTFAQFASARFGLAENRIYLLFVYAGVLGALVQGGLVRSLAPRFGEGRLVVAGTLLAFLALGSLPYVAGLPLLLVLLAVLALGVGLASPSLSSLTSKLVEADEVGGVMGVYQSLSSLGRIAGPMWGEVVYGSLGFAWPYRTGSLFMLIAGGVAVLILWRARKSDTAPG